VGELARRVMDRVRPHAEQLGSVEDFDALEDILDNGTGAARQHKVYDANHDLREVVREVVDATSPEPAEAPSD
jgi:glutamate---cysteine ligase / carboxylate-amine ligase